jgi:predicted MFS family arabinose efflux permease
VGRESWFIVAGTLLYAAGTALIPYASAAEGGIGTVSVSPPVVGQTAQVSGVALALFGTYVVIGLADSLRLPTGITLFVNEGERHDAVAGSLSLRSIAWQSGAIAGPLVAGWILDSLSFIALFWLAAGVVAASALVFAVLYDPDLAAGDR